MTEVTSNELKPYVFLYEKIMDLKQFMNSFEDEDIDHPEIQKKTKEVINECREEFPLEFAKLDFKPVIVHIKEEEEKDSDTAKFEYYVAMEGNNQETIEMSTKFIANLDKIHDAYSQNKMDESEAQLDFGD